MSKKSLLRSARALYAGLIKSAWPEGFFLGILIRIGLKAQNAAKESRKREAGERFDCRSKGSKHLVIVLVGYKPDLWPLTLERIEKFVPPEYDICLMSSGRRLERLEELAENLKWSYLSTTLNEVSNIQNLAIEHHPDAHFIFKLDEDIFIGRNFFVDLLLGHMKVIEQAMHRPGISVPIINVNGYGYVEFLKEFDITCEYRERFGEVLQAAVGIRAHSDGDAALWLWRHSLPFDKIAAKFSGKAFSYSACPHRFSIGAILFERDFWRKMGGFAVSATPGLLGYDEACICKYCMDSSQVIVVVHNVFAGHFSFGPQNQVMNESLDELRPDLAICDAPSKPSLHFQ
jgi:hypothetical protein